MNFTQYLIEAAGKGVLVNTMFEERLFALTEILHRLADAFEAASIPYELVGGLAVLVHVEEASPEMGRLTRDVDILVRREDLGRVQDAARASGFLFRHAAGAEMLVQLAEAGKLRNAVHLIFSGEKVRAEYVAAAPEIAAVRKLVHGRAISIIPVDHLLRMKLTSFRLKDQVHVQDMDAAGLITPEVEAGLVPELAARLQRVRESD